MEGMMSVVIPAYNEQDNVAALAERVRSALDGAQIPFELIFVDDGSADKTWEKISEEAKKDSRIRGLRFSRNFGKESAIFAGLRAAKGECCTVMDADLQHPPETLVRMYSLWKDKGFHVVEAKKRSRGTEKWTYRLFANMFYGLLKAMSGQDLRNGSDFRLLDRKVVNELNKMPERQTFFRAMSGWLGFETAVVEFDVAERHAGKTKFSPRRLIKYALSSIASFTAVPMQFVTGVGIAFFVFAIVLGLQTLIRKLTGHSAEGFTTVILLLLLIGSILMISLGIIGYYIARIYEEIKARPRYVLADEIGGQEDGHEAVENS